MEISKTDKANKYLECVKILYFADLITNSEENRIMKRIIKWSKHNNVQFQFIDKNILFTLKDNQENKT
jgi:hypothetical protein